jgi:hypothetical protein
MEDAVIEEESMKEIDIRRHFNTLLSFSFGSFSLPQETYHILLSSFKLLRYALPPNYNL